MAMAAFAFCRALLPVLNAAALPYRCRRFLPLRRRRLLHNDSAILMAVLGASAIFHAAVAGPKDDTDASRALTAAAAGFLIWVAGVALLLLALTAGRLNFQHVQGRLHPHV